MCFCFDDRKCGVVSVIVSAIIGVIVAFLRITGTVVVTPALLITAFGVATIFLAVYLLRGDEQVCRCRRSVNVALIGIVGTVLFSAFLLAVPFAATSILGAIFTGILAAFFALIFTASACVIRCVGRCDD